MNEFDLQDYRKAVAAKIASKSVYVADGKAEDYPEYRDRCGEIRGLEQALEILKDVLKKRGGDEE